MISQSEDRGDYVAKCSPKVVTCIMGKYATCILSRDLEQLTLITVYVGVNDEIFILKNQLKIIKMICRKTNIESTIAQSRQNASEFPIPA